MQRRQLFQKPMLLFLGVCLKHFLQLAPAGSRFAVFLNVQITFHFSEILTSCYY
jgi:hypothetical protein